MTFYFILLCIYLQTNRPKKNLSILPLAETWKKTSKKYESGAWWHIYPNLGHLTRTWSVVSLWGKCERSWIDYWLNSAQSRGSHGFSAHKAGQLTRSSHMQLVGVGGPSKSIRLNFSTQLKEVETWESGLVNDDSMIKSIIKIMKSHEDLNIWLFFD